VRAPGGSCGRPVVRLATPSLTRGVTRGRRPARQGDGATCIAIPRAAALCLRRVAPCRCAEKGPGPRTGPQADSETGLAAWQAAPPTSAIWRGAAGLLVARPRRTCFPLSARSTARERARGRKRTARSRAGDVTAACGGRDRRVRGT
jgi:hypothetical protein